VANASGSEDGAVPLSISAALADPSESLSIAISGVPAGVMLSAGTNQGGGVWTLTAAQLAGLTLTPVANSDRRFTLTVTATSTDGPSGDSASTQGTIAVTVAAVADTPSLSVTGTASGNEDTPIALSIGGSARRHRRLRDLDLPRQRHAERRRASTTARTRRRRVDRHRGAGRRPVGDARGQQRRRFT
jgi:hypothetical protein